MDFCMPKLITDAAETTINALIYATEHTPDVFHEVLTVLDKLADYAKELLSKNLLLFQRGNVSLLEMKKVSAKKGMRGLEESFMCSNKSALGRNYALMLRLQGKWGLQTGGIGAKMAIKKSKAVGAGIYFGCQKLKFKVTPFWSMRWLSKGIAFPFKEKDTDEDKFGADIQFKWYHSEFPCFPPVRFKTKAAFRVAGGAKSESGYKVTLRTSWSFFSPDITSFEQKDWVPKKPDWPSGVGITAAMKVSVGELLQANVSINQSLEEFHREPDFGLVAAGRAARWSCGVVGCRCRIDARRPKKWQTSSPLEVLTHVSSTSFA
ncbi:unnamed protein product [Durusdinium trenchii]|uniref:Uncharacterized protein n=1 Tax=Durusdinium trenchii TaxID=1381693 RepID=A0ABP0MLG0_9DINO